MHHFPRLLNTVDLSLPLEDLRGAILQWASQQGHGEVEAESQLAELKMRLLSHSERTERGRHLCMDIDVALGAIDARRKEHPHSFDDYAASWEAEVRSVASGDINEMDQLRRLQERFGGILLNSRSAPFLLLVPLSDGTWLQVGWESIQHVAGNPLTQNTEGPEPLELAIRNRADLGLRR